jgi:thiol-disulfide isomerase/thioredoxin
VTCAVEAHDEIPSSDQDRPFLSNGDDTLGWRSWKQLGSCEKGTIEPMLDLARARPSRSLVPALLIAILALQAQEPRKEFTDPVALLKAVAKTYAAGVDTFRMESIAEITSNADLHHEWRKVYRTAIKGPGTLYRIESRSPFGSMIQDSDGTSEWVYQVEGNMYLKRPLPPNWPQFSRLLFAGNNELMEAWGMRTSLEQLAAGNKQTTMLPQETITVLNRSYPCYVVHVAEAPILGVYSDITFWIDKAALIFRKQVRHASTYATDANSAIHIPYLEDSTIVYPAAEFNQQIAPETFTFTPPPTARLVDKLEPGWYTPSPLGPKARLAGQTAPDVSFMLPDGGKVALSSYLGKPLLLDFWATWCGPCLASMPALARIYRDVKNKGVAVVTIDRDNAAEDAADYLVRHGYSWTNYHDADGEVARAFKDEAIPLTILIDGLGKIVYYDFGGDEAAVRTAIAALGPEFGSIATPASGNSPPPRR